MNLNNSFGGHKNTRAVPATIYPAVFFFFFFFFFFFLLMCALRILGVLISDAAVGPNNDII